MTQEYNSPIEKIADAINPLVTMDWDMWCEPHLRFLKDKWPKGAGLAMMALFQAGAENEEIAKYCDGDVGKLTQALKHYSPVCCFLGEEVMTKLTNYVKTEVKL
jgi:hypothetical protein